MFNIFKKITTRFKVSEPIPLKQVEEDSDSLLAKKEAEKELYEESVERATLLLTYTKDQYDYSLERMRRIEDKSIKLFASVSVITTALVLTIRFVGDELLKSELGWWVGVTLGTGALTFLSLFVAWAYVFLAVTLKDLPVLETGEKASEYILSTPRNESLWNASDKYHEAIEKLTAIHDSKAWRINISIIAMWCTAVFFASFVVIVILHNLFQEGGMMNNRKPPEKQDYVAPLTYVVKQANPSTKADQLFGSVTGRMSLPQRSRPSDGLQLGVALESYQSLYVKRTRAKA